MTTQRPFAVFDIDGTIIRWQLYHAIVTELADAGKLSQEKIEAIESTRHMWRNRSHDASFHAYEEAIVDGYHSAIKDLTIDEVTTVIDTVFSAEKDRVYTYTRDLAKSLKQQGYLLFAVSGSQQEIVEHFGAYYDFDEVIGAKYITQNGRFTGERKSPVVSGKGILVKELVERHNASWKGSVAVGDTFSDTQMLALVERPIAFNPNKELFQEAQKQGWDVVVERKNMTYRLTQHDQTYQLVDDTIA